MFYFMSLAGNRGRESRPCFATLRFIFTNRALKVSIAINFAGMLREIIITKDGSHTVSIPHMNVTYHSVHGAIQESMHVFIQAGFYHADKPGDNSPVRIFEMGFGTGLNALLTLIEAGSRHEPVYYTAIELSSLAREEIKYLNYCQQLNRKDLQPVFEELHFSAWEKQNTLTPWFTLYKSAVDLLQLDPANYAPYHLIYFDAFAPGAQPELWTKEIFEKLYQLLLPGGLLVTYCSKGDVRRAMQSAGFAIEKIPGPPGKREMIRARRN